MRKNTTVEGKAKTKNGVVRLTFCAVAILLQILFWGVLLVKLNQYTQIGEAIIRAVSLILVLFIYSKNKTSTVKMPWIILILVAPVLGVVLYLSIGLDYSTRKMRKCYQQVDEVLFKKLPENSDVMDVMSTQCPQALGITSYLYNYSYYPVSHNTDVIYYDDAAKGLEAQLNDLAKAEHFNQF